MKILITGAAGFIGFSFTQFLLKKKNKYKIIGLDNINDYYSKKYKKLRLKELSKHKNFKFFKLDIRNLNNLEKLFKKNKFDIIFNFAAQAGVRYSIKYPDKYVESNINGFFNILDLVKKYRVKKLVYASSSSVYGEQKTFPSKEMQKLNPNNIYSLSKNFNENLAEIYSNLYGTISIGLRFFTVYGEWGRPDMLLFKIFNSIEKNKLFELNNSGNHFRDFTSVNDVNNIMLKLMKTKMTKKHTVLNICSSNTINIKNIIKLIKTRYNFRVKNTAKNSADLIKTHGSNKKLLKIIGKYKFENLDNLIFNLIEWYKKKEISKIT